VSLGLDVLLATTMRKGLPQAANSTPTGVRGGGGELRSGPGFHCDPGGSINPVKKYGSIVFLEISVRGFPASLPESVVVDDQYSPRGEQGKQVKQRMIG
jgi:hypothetical protein